MAASSEGRVALPPQFFQRTSLLVLTILSGTYAIVTVVAPTPWVDVPLGLLTLLFVPGYALGALAFGAKPRWPWSLTFAIVVGLSVAFNVGLGLVLLQFNYGLTAPAFGFAALILLMAASFSWVVRPPVESGSRFSKFLGEELRLPGHTPAQRAVGYALFVSIVLVIALIVFIASIFPTPAGNLSLGLVGPGGSTSDLPMNGTVANGSATIVYTIGAVVTNSASAQKFTLMLLAGVNSTPPTSTPSVNWSSPTVALNLSGATRCNVTLNLTGSEAVTQKVHFYFSTRGWWDLTFNLLDATGHTVRTVEWTMVVQ